MSHEDEENEEKDYADEILEMSRHLCDTYEAVIAQAQIQLGVMVDRDPHISHDRFNATLKRSLEDLLTNKKEGMKVVLLQGLCSTRKGAYLKKLGYPGEISMDLEPDGPEVSSRDMYEKICKECPSMHAYRVIHDAIAATKSFKEYRFNVRNDCELIPGTNRCAPPSLEVGRYNAHHLNFVAAIHAGVGVKIHYISIGGQSAMKNITDHLIPGLWATQGSCFHMSLMTR
jgi:hypothetical protein